MKQNKPLAYVLGEVEFFKCKILLNQHVLIPRQESEILVFYALERLKERSHGVLLDLCTGSGCLGLAIKKARPDIHVILSDISPQAIECAKKNALMNQLDVEFLEGDLLKPLARISHKNFEKCEPDRDLDWVNRREDIIQCDKASGDLSQDLSRGGSDFRKVCEKCGLAERKIDYVICNPPYVSEAEYECLDSSVRDYEPKLALVGGKEGLDFYADLSKSLKAHMKDQGKIFFEIGKDQGNSVLALFSDPYWKNKQILKDWAGHDRFFFLET